MSEPTITDRARAAVRKYQAEIDFNGWSDDLLEKVLTETIRNTEARVREEAAQLFSRNFVKIVQQDPGFNFEDACRHQAAQGRKR